MATGRTPLVPLAEEAPDAALRHTHWRKRVSLSSAGGAIEHFLETAGFDRAPWLVVAFACGIAAWFILPSPIQWIIAICAGVCSALMAAALWRGQERRNRLLLSGVCLGLLFSAGMGTIWLRSELVGVPGIAEPLSGRFEGRVLERIEQPAQERVRLVIATRHPESQEPIKIRINVPNEFDREEFCESAHVRFDARLMPPAPPMLPGGYNFARTAWFEGLSATGSSNGEIELLEAGDGQDLLSRAQRSLSSHVISKLDGAPGAIAAAFASGDRGAISSTDEDAMRDAGLTHLLSISGLHVSAVIAAVYLLAIKLLALWPWLTLRVRLPVLAAATAALAGIGYTLLTGAQVPTVRSCVAAMLVLGALALGRDALSLRMVAVAAFFVLLLWPESLVGPSFQMSFAAVITIVALHGSAAVRKFISPREEAWWKRTGRAAFMLLVTGLVIEIALMPIVLFHFHRAGIYGALANVVAIPLVTFVSMPLIALALVLDIVGAGAPVWWLAGKSLDLLLAIAHFTAGQPGAVKLMPQMGLVTFGLFLIGGLWIALWQGRVRLCGFVPVLGAIVMLISTPVPDLLISGDGRHVGITLDGERLLVLRESRSDYARDNLMELAGVQGEPTIVEEWPDADCSRDFCVLSLTRAGRDWQILMGRSRNRIPERALAAACERADIVVVDRWLPRSCQPRWLKADRRFLEETGGLAIMLDGPRLESVAESQGQHGWWSGQGRD